MTSLDAEIRIERPDGFDLDVSIDVPAGTTAALLGPNGAGKSTIVGAIAGLDPIDSGRISVLGVVLDDPGAGVFVAPEHRNVGAVFHGGLLFPHLTVLENVAFPLRSRGVGTADARGRAKGWLERLEMSAHSGRRPGELSGGEVQRVALARALAADPDALLLDEPMSALDVQAKAELRQLLAAHLGGFAGPRLLITHDPAEAFLLADTIHIIENGRITQAGTPDDIRLRPRTRYAADLAGVNLLEGVAQRGMVDVEGRRIDVADDELDGPVLVAVPPTAISVHPSQPVGSQRNTWQTSVDRLERLGTRVRLRTAPPVSLTVELTDRAVAALGLDVGSVVWIAFKATEISAESR